ncbi:hypothetical protein [Tabrizicola sp.]|uniref:hypothetical protein n=1 Tax=Tabrizicola sp. TaxID=2005166 RepID=UPI002734FA50|nr:hypothetical protein [Tabrizicola sp.]MDP3196668.1 hypothetical protein [Tabrizicola sp.]
MNVGIGYIVVGAAFFFWYWWEPVRERWDGTREGQIGLVVVGLMASGFGLWELAKLGCHALQVTVDRDGITDIRVSDKLILGQRWSGSTTSPFDTRGVRARSADCDWSFVPIRRHSIGIQGNARS